MWFHLRRPVWVLTVCILPRLDRKDEIAIWTHTRNLISALVNSNSIPSVFHSLFPCMDFE